MKRNIKINLGSGFWFVAFIQTIFIVLKLGDAVTWNWGMVFLPTIICVSLKVFILIACIGILIANIFKD